MFWCFGWAGASGSARIIHTSFIKLNNSDGKANKTFYMTFVIQKYLFNGLVINSEGYLQFQLGTQGKTAIYFLQRWISGCASGFCAV